MAGKKQQGVTGIIDLSLILWYSYHVVGAHQPFYHMSGHSKWSQIKRQKAVTDSRRSALFTKVAKVITLAAREGGSDPDTNFRLRLAVQKAREANMPNDNIERAIKRGTGDDGSVELFPVLYEAYGPGGIGLVIEGVTDNKNRTAAEIRSILTKAGGSLASANSVAWQFDHRGVVRLAKEHTKAVADSENVQLAIIDAGAEDVREEDEGWTIVAPKESFSAVLELIENKHIPITSQGMEYLPQNLIRPDSEKTIQSLIEQLEEHDDVENVYTNADI